MANLPAGRQDWQTCTLEGRMSKEKLKDMFDVYVIRSVNRNYLYVGLTNNFERRFKEHNKEQNRTTKPYAPFVLVIKEIFSTRIKAREREKYFKTGSGKEYLKSL
jgi:putative endonuclease